MQIVERCHAIVEGSDDAIVGKTMVGIVTSWNRGAERILGFVADEIVGGSIERILPAEWLDEENFILRELAEGRCIDLFDTVRVRKSGRQIPVCLTVSAIRDARDIGVASVPEEGSPFWFTLGLVEAGPSAAEPEEEFEAANGDPVSGRILIVDDIDANREIVEAYLDGLGYRIDAVGSAIDAIQMVGTDSFDLVLMDIQMPVMDGVTATKRIRALPKPMRDVPILAMTGNVLPMQIKSFLDAGMNGHIAKPFSRAKLHESVKRWGSRGSSPPGEPAPSASADEDGTVDELIGAVGVERAWKIAIDFASQLNGAFPPDCTLAGARDQAHGLINGAGILGLPRFVGACQALECQPADAASESAALARIRVETALARDFLSGQLLPRLRDRTLEPTG